MAPYKKPPQKRPVTPASNLPPRQPKPPKDGDGLEMDGEVVQHIMGRDYNIEVEGIGKVKAYASGKMKFNKITITVGDKVKVKINPNDWTQGIITFRYK